jgi:sec-independent protein translocase protein TatA
MNLRPQELLIILLIVLVLFGARKLPELARSLGSSAKEFRKGIQEGQQDATTTEEEKTPDK